jgi:hypothetical protein
MVVPAATGFGFHPSAEECDGNVAVCAVVDRMLRPVPDTVQVVVTGAVVSRSAANPSSTVLPVVAATAGDGCVAPAAIEPLLTIVGTGEAKPATDMT